MKSAPGKPKPQADPKHEHKVLGATHPDLFAGSGGVEKSAKGDSAAEEKFESAAERLAEAKSGDKL